jgi:hypothetical protein
VGLSTWYVPFRYFFIPGWVAFCALGTVVQILSCTCLPRTDQFYLREQLWVFVLVLGLCQPYSVVATPAWCGLGNRPAESALCSLSFLLHRYAPWAVTTCVPQVCLSVWWALTFLPGRAGANVDSVTLCDAGLADTRVWSTHRRLTGTEVWPRPV